MTIRKESKQYIRQQRKIDADLVKRPNEILKRSTDDGNLKLTFKSPTYYEKDIVVTKNAMLTTTPLIKTYASLETSESFILDLEGQEIITYNLTQNTTITDVINYNNGMSYKLYLKQDEVGGKSFVFDETISNITLFDNFQIDQTPNSITQIKIDVVEDTLYVQSYVNYKKVKKPFIFTIDTTKGSGNSFTLPLRNGYNYDFVVDWGDGNTDEITSYNQAEKSHTYLTGGEYQVKVSGLCEAWYFNNGGDRLKLISIDQWGNTGFISMENAFRGCSNLTGFTDSDGGWCSGVTNMYCMFRDCSSLTTLDVSNWGVSSVTNMFGMFLGCKSLTTLDVSDWDTSSVTDMSQMFYFCSSLTTLDVSNWDTSSVTSMSWMFGACSSLTTLDLSNWDVINVIDVSGMFQDCSSLTTLDVSNWNTSSVTDMGVMFESCSLLTTLDVSNWDTSRIIRMGDMFRACSSLTTLDVSKWNTSKVTNMRSMFQDCSSLTTLDISGWNVSNVTTMFDIFNGCPLSTESYDALLIGWSQLPSLKPNVSFYANLVKYSAGAAATARQYIIDTYGWGIQDGGQIV